MRTSARAIKKRFKRFTNYGKRCKVYGPGCSVCEGYRFLLERGRFPYSFEEHWEFMKDVDPDAPSIAWKDMP